MDPEYSHFTGLHSLHQVFLSPRLTVPRDFYRMRVERIRTAELAKRNQQRMKDPSFFPTAPRGDVV
jgi:AAA-ATPase Vps4-associated protein 1